MKKCFDDNVDEVFNITDTEKIENETTEHKLENEASVDRIIYRL